MSININIHAHLWKMEENQVNMEVKKILADMDAVVVLFLPIG